MSEDANVIWTIGHSTHPWPKFVQLLQDAKIELLADVRRFPASRRHPQFNGSLMEAALAKVAIGYRHFEDLGGRRSERLSASPNTAWQVEPFNAYADHTQSPEFLAALKALLHCSAEKRAAVMCAEAVPWQCHRRVLADVLIARGCAVRHIFPNGQIRPHALTEFAVLQGGGVIYPGGLLFR